MRRWDILERKYFELCIKKGMVEDFPECNLEVDFCQHFIYGKQIWVRFQFETTREKGIKELVHSDVFGHVSVPSLGGSLYYFSFIDDFSRKTWIYFLRKKEEVLEKFKEFKSLIENHTNNNIKVLRNDNGGELCGKEFDQFYKHHFIARSCWENEQNIDGQGKEHAQWCWARARFLGGGS
jgi:hypothetical protein